MKRLSQLLQHLCIVALLLAWAGASLTAAGAVHYVNVNSTSPVAPYSDWSTAAKIIQDAVDVASAGDTVLVTNGIYQSGGRVAAGTLTNRVVVTNALVLQSVNGPAHTTLAGAHSLFPSQPNVRCLYLTGGAGVCGFTLSGGGTPTSSTSGPDSAGGGFWCPDGSCVVSNCIIAQNYGSVAAAGGGTVNNSFFTNNQCSGANGCVLNNCLLAHNAGSGAMNSAIINCTVVFNNTSWTSPAAGALYCSVTNSLVYYNPDGGGAVAGSANYLGSHFDSSCTWPIPPTGRGNFSNSPAIVSTGNFHLTATSPCINAGENPPALPPIDLDGKPRIVGGTVDVGAYEFQTPASVISYAWLHSYGWPTDGSVDYLDFDGDGMNNWQEWRCGTDPLDAASVLMVTSVSNSAGGVTVTWQSVTNRTYSVERATDLSVPAGFLPIASGVAGQLGTTTFTDPGASSPDAAYYRIRVEP